MSSPTGSEPNFTKGSTPQPQPGYGPSAPQAHGTQGYDPSASPSSTPAGYGSPAGHGSPGYGSPGYGSPGYGSPAGHGAPTGQRPGTVTAAAIIAIVWGGLGALFGLIGLSVAFFFSALLGLILLVALAVSIGLLVGGIFVLTGKSPRLLLMISYAAIGINLLSLVISLAQNGGNAFSGVLGFILPGVVVALLLQPQSKQYFAARGLPY